MLGFGRSFRPIGDLDPAQASCATPAMGMGSEVSDAISTGTGEVLSANYQKMIRDAHCSQSSVGYDAGFPISDIPSDSVNFDPVDIQ